MNLSGDMMDAAWNLGLWTLPCAALFVVSFSILLPIGRWQTRHVPGYLGWPMVGNLLDIQRLTWHGFHEQGFFTFGGVFRMFYGADPHIVVASAESVRHVLKHCPHVFEFPVPFGHEDRGMLLDGLAFARDSKYHSRLRSAWLPSFSPTSLSLFQECFEKKADELVRELKQLVSAEGNATVEIWQMLSSVSFAIISSTGFGLDMPLDLKGPSSSQSKSHARRVLNAFHKILEASSPDKTGIWLPIFLMVHPSFRGPIRTLANLFPDKTMRMLMKSQKELREIAMELIQIERAKEKTGTTEGRSSFLKHLLSLKDLSDTEIAANVYTWLGTGAETPANAMAYTIYLLSLHPECEAKVVKEISSSEGPFPYLDACCQESMRLMSPASKILRQATSDVTLPNGIRLNKGTKFQVSLRMAMLDPEAWFEPLKFNPMRFVDKDETTSNFVAWGGGTRLCIGMKFAEKMMRTILSRLLREFRFELEPGQVPVKVQTGLTMTPVDGIRMRLSRRQA